MRRTYEYSAALATMARIYDIAALYCGSFRESERTGLPRTYEEYVRMTYGEPRRDWMTALNYGLLGSVLALLAAIAWWLR